MSAGASENDYRKLIRVLCLNWDTFLQHEYFSTLRAENQPHQQYFVRNFTVQAWYNVRVGVMQYLHQLGQSCTDHIQVSPPLWGPQRRICGADPSWGLRCHPRCYWHPSCLGRARGTRAITLKHRLLCKMALLCFKTVRFQVHLMLDCAPYFIFWGSYNLIFVFNYFSDALWKKDP